MVAVTGVHLADDTSPVSQSVRECHQGCEYSTPSGHSPARTSGASSRRPRAHVATASVTWARSRRSGIVSGIGNDGSRASNNRLTSMTVGRRESTLVSLRAGSTTSQSLASIECVASEIVARDELEHRPSERHAVALEVQKHLVERETGCTEFRYDLFDEGAVAKADDSWIWKVGAARNHIEIAELQFAPQSTCSKSANPNSWLVPTASHHGPQACRHSLTRDRRRPRPRGCGRRAG